MLLFNEKPVEETAVGPVTNNVTALNTELAGLPAQLQDWTERSARAQAALDAIVEIKSDEQDAAAEEVLIKSRDTFDYINKSRLVYTKKLDEVKAFTMQPEKAISTDAKATDSNYNRVRNLRNAWAQEKLDKQRADEARILKEKYANEEKTRIKAAIELNIHDGIVDALATMDKSVTAYLKEFTVENFDTKSERFNIKPKLQEQLFNSWFHVTYSPNLLVPDEYNAFIAQIKAVATYESINEKYVTLALPIIEGHKNSLPKLKEDLIHLENLQKEDAVKAAELQAENERKAKEAQDKKDLEAQQQKEAHATQVQEAASHEQLNQTFDAQVSLQQANADLKNVITKKVASITGPKENIVEIFANVLYCLYNNPKFVGHYKIDKVTGDPLLDENGAPVFQDWADQLLDLYANMCDTPIDGITLKEVVVTKAKKQKA